MMNPSIYSYIKSKENDFESDEIRIGDNWNWNFRNHVQLIFHLKNGIFYTGENNWMRAFKNIMEPILNLSYWTEDLEVKDVLFYIENSKNRVLSFLIKKYHDEVYVKEHDLDTLFDEITESDIDYGAVLVQKTNKGRPEVIELNTIAFCDQTDMLGGPIAFKHAFSPDKLRSMSKYGWGNPKNGATISLEELVTLASFEKDPNGLQDTKKNEVPGKVVEVYIMRGSLPEHYLKDNDNFDTYYNQLHIVGFYTDKKGKKEGVTLYRSKEDEGNLKVHTSKKVSGRAIGRGGGETLLSPQIWTNFLSIHKMNLMEAASKVPLVTDDQNFHNKNKIQDMENLEVTTIEEGKSIQSIQTAAVNNIQLFDSAVNEWLNHAQLAGAAFDPILGKEQSSGTTFRGQERTVAQGRGSHDKRRGQRAKFIESIYRDWIIPDIVKEILDGKEFMATLSIQELRWVQEQLAQNHAVNKFKEALLEKGTVLTQEEIDLIKQTFTEALSKKGNKHIIKILKDEFRDIGIKVGINIAGKQKDLANLSDKILSVFQFIFSNPQAFQQAMQIPALSESFQDILEFSGLNQSNFMDFTSTVSPVQPAQETPELSLNQAQPQT